MGLAYIKKNTENNAIKNYSGIFIEAQMDNLTTEDLEIYKYIRKKIGKDPKPSQY